MPHESPIDRAIREATERGDFDDLPGLGKPLPDSGRAYDEDWWLKDLIRRENLTDIAPATLLVRKEAEGIAETVAKFTTEARVREAVADLNERIWQVRRGLVDGPPVPIALLDADAVVAGWRSRRS
ncbi:MAG: DUF1992 domain-containing protein [Catenulispora sp.]|nr:DUF1992 domain-containing protein [Catenulispora sp.]